MNQAPRISKGLGNESSGYSSYIDSSEIQAALVVPAPANPTSQKALLSITERLDRSQGSTGDHPHARGTPRFEASAGGKNAR